jgi:ornithine cyclodeaminase/alanine dehydrogenase-like protein (mu-crystallin family)
VLLLNNDDITRVLTPQMTIDALDGAYRAFARGDAVCRPRIDIRIPTDDPTKYYQWGTMEGGAVASYFAIRMKSDVVYETRYNGVVTEEKYCTQPGTYCGLILLVKVNTGEPAALINDGVLQHMRVAGDAALGARAVAREDSRVLGMLGSGGMARSFAEALVLVRRIEQINVYSPTRENRERYAREMSAKLGIRVTAADDPASACRGADILASCTDSATPVIRGEWLEEGMHVVAVGGRPHDDALARFDLRLRLGTAPAPLERPTLQTADEWIAYAAAPHSATWENFKRKGLRGATALTRPTDLTYADVLEGRGGRTDARQISFSERGNLQGLQFYSVAAAAYEAAVREGVGRPLPQEWFLQDIRD